MLGYIQMTQLNSTEGNVSNCIFGGPGNRTLYITGYGGAYKVDLRVPGRMPSALSMTAPRFGGKLVAPGVYVLDSDSRYGAANMGWIDEGDHVVLVREQGTGRVCYMTNGHTRQALGNPMYQRLLRNAMLWCLNRKSMGTGSKGWWVYN